MVGAPQLFHGEVREPKHALGELQAEQVEGEVFVAQGGLDEGDVVEDVGFAGEDGEGYCGGGRRGGGGGTEEFEIVDPVPRKADDVAYDGDAGLCERGFAGVHWGGREFVED